MYRKNTENKGVKAQTALETSKTLFNNTIISTILKNPQQRLRKAEQDAQERYKHAS